MEYSVFSNGEEIIVSVSLKKMKQVRLKVFPSGTVKLSAPIDTPDDWIQSYLNQKAGWIQEKLDHFKKTRAIEKEEHFFSGASTRVLGRQLTIHMVPSSRKQIYIEDDKLVVLTSESEQIKIDKQVGNWWQKTSKQYYQKLVDELYPIIQKHGVARPAIVVKKMSTLWGSCSRAKHKINLNYYLYKASVPCIEYVILHELTHFLYPHHDRAFYDFLTIHMPDWQDRKKQLDYEFVLGV